jgi:hypothetical protein
MNMNKDKLTKKDIASLNRAFDELISAENDTISYEKLIAKLNTHNSYIGAFELLMEYWDYIPDCEIDRVNKKLSRLGL